MMTRYYPFALTLKPLLLAAAGSRSEQRARSLDFHPGGACGAAARGLCALG
jgi:hypothetical protein